MPTGSDIKEFNDYKCFIRSLNNAAKAMGTVCDKYIFQLEAPPPNMFGYVNYHYQCYCHLKKKKRVTQFSKHLNIHMPGVKVQAASTEGKEALKAYSMKEDTRYDGPWADRPIYMGRDLLIFNQKGFYPWQQFILDKIKEEPDPRKIICIVDPKGGQGKSIFGKYLKKRHDAGYLPYGECKDIINFVGKNMGKRLYMFDLSRMKPRVYSTNDVYSAIESIKLGLITNFKYETSQHEMEPPHIIIFTNQYPDLESLSKDRWEIYGIMHHDKSIFKYGGGVEERKDHVNTHSSSEMESKEEVIASARVTVMPEDWDPDFGMSRAEVNHILDEMDEKHM